MQQLRAELDAFARTRLTEADFDPVLDIETELHLDDVTPALCQMLALLEPYGTGNHEPAFSALNVGLTAPPKILKDKHIKLKLKANSNGSGRKLSPVFDSLGWHMAERLEKSPLLAGDAIDIAFTITHNDHSDFGGIDLELRDFQTASINPDSHLRSPNIE